MMQTHKHLMNTVFVAQFIGSTVLYIVKFITSVLVILRTLKKAIKPGCKLVIKCQRE